MKNLDFDTMKQLLFISVLSILLSGAACSENPQTIQVNSHEFNKLISESDGVLLDVRTQREFKNGHIENSGQLNFYAFDFRKRLLLLPKDKPVYLYCNTGYRSNKAADFLLKNGYTQVYNLQHGIMEWEQEDLPVTVDPDAQPDTDDLFATSDFEQLILSDSLVLIDFYAPWCGPCRQMMPMIDSLKVDYHERIQIVKINADASKKLMRDLKMVTVPYFALYHRGALIFEHKGLIEREQLTAILEKNYNKWRSNENK